MAKRKRMYESYNVVADFGQVNEDFCDYRLAYEAYCKQRRYQHPATLFGRTFEGEIRVIRSAS
jgi:hypothetical protein